MVAVPTPANPHDDPADIAALAAHAAALADAVEAALPQWVERSVADRWRAWSDDAVPVDLARTAQRAGQQAVADLGPALRGLLAADVDEQRSNPMAVVRRAVEYPTAVLADAGVPPVARDEQAERLFPDDAYDLTPGAFADLGPSVHEPGLVWGAAKAHVILKRRRGEGR